MLVGGGGGGGGANGMLTWVLVLDYLYVDLSCYVVPALNRQLP